MECGKVEAEFQSIKYLIPKNLLDEFKRYKSKLENSFFHEDEQSFKKFFQTFGMYVISN